MIEDTILTEYKVGPLDPDRILSAENGEKAYELLSVNHGVCKNAEDEKTKLTSLKSSPDTLAFELDTEVDYSPFVLETYNADKALNVAFHYGEHEPGGDKYQEPSQFKSGDKVLCILHQGMNVVIPAIVVGPVSEEYMRQEYETDEDAQLHCDSVETYLSWFEDFDWDSLVVRPLVFIENDWNPMTETIFVPRAYVFPYKTFEV